MNPGVLVEGAEGGCGRRLRPQLPGLVPLTQPVLLDDTYFESVSPFQPSAAAAAAFSVSTRPSSTLFSLESHEAGCSGEFQFEELSRGQKTRYFHRAYPLPLGWCHLGIDLRTEASQ